MIENKLRKLCIAVALLISIQGQSLFAQVQVSSSLTLVGREMPGGSYEGSIQLKNLGNKAEEVRIYMKDYFYFADGRSVYEAPGSNERSNALWIEFFPNILTIAPRAEAEIGYRVQIPDRPELAGTYWSLLFVEEVPTQTDTPKSEDSFTLSITQVVRYGIQLVTEIGDTGYGLLAIENPAVNQEDQRNALEIDVINTGTIWLQPTFTCTIFDLLGNELEVVEGGEKRLYPGTSAKLAFRLSELVSGKYRALVLADAGGENLFGANYTLELEE
jgi:hypothetical protein